MGREGWFVCDFCHHGTDLAACWLQAGALQTMWKAEDFSLSLCSLGVVACKVAARCMARGKQGPICPSRTLKETEAGRDAAGSADRAFLSLN